MDGRLHDLQCLGDVAQPRTGVGTFCATCGYHADLQHIFMSGVEVGITNKEI